VTFGYIAPHALHGIGHDCPTKVRATERQGLDKPALPDLGALWARSPNFLLQQGTLF
jgi:hypothetical protein